MADPMVVTVQLTGDVVEVECPGGSIETILGLPPALIARDGESTVMVDWIGNVWVSGMDEGHPQVLHRGRSGDVIRLFGDDEDLLAAISEKVAQGRNRLVAE